MSNKTFIKTLTLSEGQKDFFLHYLLYPTSNYYNEQLAFEFHGRMEVPIVEQTLEEILSRHEIYRTVFILEDEPIQKVYSETVKDFKYINALSWDEIMIKEYLYNEFNTPYVLEEGPLFSMRLLDINEHDCIICFKWHHICTDGWSMSLTIDEFTMIYKRLIEDSSYKMPSPKLQYSDFIEWQKSYLSSEEAEEARRFWKKKLTGSFSELKLPADFIRPDKPSFKGGTLLFKFNLQLQSEFYKYIKLSNYKPNVVFLTLYIALLHRLSSQTEFIIGVPRVGRTTKDFYEIMGYFVNVLPLRVEIKEGFSFADLLFLVNKELNICSQFQDYPLTMIVSQLAAFHNERHSSVFQACFVHQKAVKQKAAIMLGHATNSIETNGVIAIPYCFNKNISQFDLCLTIEKENNNNILASFEYNKDIFHEQTIKKWIDEFEISSLLFLENDNELISRGKKENKITFRKDIMGISSENILTSDFDPLLNELKEIHVVNFELSFQVKSNIYKLAQDCKTNISNILITAFNILLYGETEKEDILIAFHPKEDEFEEENSLIFYLRTDLSGNPLFSELVKQIEIEMKEAIHNKKGLEKDCFRSRLNTFHNPQLLFVIDSIKEVYDLSCYELIVQMVDLGDVLKGTIEYNAHFFKRTTIERIVARFIALLEAVFMHSFKRIREILSYSETKFFLVNNFEELFD
ncbi:condensation domain-containing protein [Paenibacillus sp. FSL H8-0122]|uniref:condensation domain-containing protein n=1 Tax=Paenibacillus sp. FSL H8-0122 TaxID=2954510 RepID=UPI0030F7F1C0